MFQYCHCSETPTQSTGWPVLLYTSAGRCQVRLTARQLPHEWPHTSPAVLLAVGACRCCKGAHLASSYGLTQQAAAGGAAGHHL